MAKTPEVLMPANLTGEQAKQGVTRLRKRLAEVQAFSPNDIDPGNPTAAVAALRAAIDDTLVRSFGNNTVEYERYRAAGYFNWPIQIGGTSHDRIRESLWRCRQTSEALLQQAIKSLEELIEETAENDVAPMTAVSDDEEAQLFDGKKVFIVHGHAEGPREAIARFLVQAGLDRSFSMSNPIGARR